MCSDGGRFTVYTHTHSALTVTHTLSIALWQSSASLRGVWTMYSIHKWHTLIYSTFTLVLVTADKSDPKQIRFHKGWLVCWGKSRWCLPLSTTLTPSSICSACTFNYSNHIGDYNKLATNTWWRLWKYWKQLCLLNPTSLAQSMQRLHG